MIRVVGLIVMIFLSVGCTQAALMSRFIPKEEAAFAEAYLSLFPSRDFAKIEEPIDPRLKDQHLRTTLEAMAALFPNEVPKHVRIVGAQTNTVDGITTVTLLFEFEYSNAWLLADVVTQKTDHGPLVRGVNVKRRTESLAYTNRFSLSGKSLVHYGILAGAVAVPVLMMWAAVLAYRIPIPRRKWLWILFILTGFFQISLNWTNGHVGVNPARFQIFGAGFVRAGPFAPVTIYTSFPLGAIVFLIRRRKWLTQPQSNPPGEG